MARPGITFLSILGGPVGSGAGSAATDTSGRPSASGLKPGTSASLFNVTAGGGAVETVTVDAQGKASFTTVKQPGQSYVIDGTARLDAGPGQVVAPAAPTMTLTGGNGQVSIAWTDGANGGSAITSHGLYRGTVSGNLRLIGFITSGSPYVDAGLTNGTAYIYQLSGKNGAGESVRTAEATATPAAAPAAVTITGTPQVGQVLTASESSNWSVGGVARNFLAASTTYKPVPGDVGKTITATGATSGLTSTATSVVINAALPATSPPLAYGARLTAIGDSIIQQNVAGVSRPSDTSQGGVHGGASGEIGQMLTFEARVNALNWYDNTKGTSTSRFTNGCIQGLNGNTSAQSAARFDTDVTPLSPDITLVAVGTNDISSPSTIVSNISAMVTKRRNANAACIVATVRPTSPAGEATRPKAQIQAANDAIRSYVAGLGSDRVVLWDVYKQYDRGDGYGDPGDYADGQLHPGDFGAELGAWGLDPTTPAPDSLAFAVRKLVGAGDVFADVMAANPNILTNGTMTGSAAASGTNISGVRPTSWTWSPVGTLASSVVCSLEGNAETGGQTAVATITPGGSASFERMLFQPQALQAVSGLAGQWVRFFAEIETDGCPWLSSPLAAIIEYDTGVSKQISRAILPAGTYPGMRSVAHRRRIMTDPVLMDATAATQIGVTVQIAWRPSGATGTTAVKIRRVWASTVPNPKPAWGQ